MTIIKSYIVTNAAASSSGSGLASFTVGNLSPVFTASLGADPLVNPSITFTAVNQNANLFYAGPATGVAAAPTFRALVVNDLPYVFSNGLTRSGNDVKLGGEVVSSTLVKLNSNPSTILQITDNTEGVGLFIDAIKTSIASGVVSFSVAGNDNSLDAVFSDIRTAKVGIVYGAAGYVTTDRSLVDKGFADATYAPISVIGTIGGSIAITQVPFGSGANTISGDANFTFDATNDALTVNGLRIGRMAGVTANSGLYIGSGAGVQTTWATSHGRNTVAGTSAGSSLTDGPAVYDGSYNSFFGYQAGRLATSATASSFFGYNSGNGITTAINNSLFGASVGSGSSFNGSSNSFFGSNIATNATTAYENTIMGAGSGIGLISGFRNSYFGLFAGAQTTTGSHNCAFGSESFQRIYTNSGNSGYGFYTGVYVMGANNAFFGAYAGGATLGLPPAGTGYNMNGNTFLGVNTGVTNINANESVTGTNYSTFIGYESGGGSSTQVEYSTALGYRAKVYTSRSMVFGSEIDGDRVNYGFGGESYASGVGISFFKNAVTNPSGNPTNGFILYSDGAVAKILNGTGSAITIMGNPMTTEGDIILGGASGAATRLAIGTNAYVLTSNGTTASWAAAASGFADPMTTRGDIIIRNAANATARLGIGTATYVLTSDGTDVAWAASASGGWAVTGTTTITGNTVIDFGATGTAPYTNEFRADNLTNTSTVGRGLVLNNNTAATGGATVQYGPSLTIRGRAWTGAVSQTVDFKQYVLTATAATPTGNWILASSINGGADVINMRVHNNGNGLGVEFNAGGFTVSGTSNALLIGAGNTTLRASAASSLLLQYNVTSGLPSSNIGISLGNVSANVTATSGTFSAIGIVGGVLSASGTLVYNMVLANQTINNAGNGIASLFNIAPTWTATGGDAYFLNYNPTVTSITGVHYCFRATSGNMLIGGTALTTNAILDLQSTSRAFIAPRMTTAEKAAIGSPSEGMLVYDTDLDKYCHYSAATTTWQTMTSI